MKSIKNDRHDRRLRRVVGAAGGGRCDIDIDIHEL